MRRRERTTLTAVVLSTMVFIACGDGDRNADEGPANGRVSQALVDVSTCGPKNLARNTTGSGTPSPLGSSPGTGDPWDLVDGATEYLSEARGLQFNFGGARQVTVDLGGEATLGELTLWHHSDNGQAGHNIPDSVSLEYFHGGAWHPLAGFSRSFDLGYLQPATGFGSYPDTYSFSPIVASQMRWSYDGSGLNVLGTAFGDPALSLPSDAVALSAGLEFSCLVRQTGEVMCWGDSEWGQLGNGGNTHSTVPVAVSGLGDAVDVQSGIEHNCALRANGQVACWGRNNTGQLGNGTNVNAAVPVTVSNLTDAIAVDTGRNHSCALRQTGEVVCWGYGGRGQLGNGLNISSNTPVTVALPAGSAVAIGLGPNHSCAILQSGGVSCWGLGTEGQLGNGQISDSGVPVQVSGLSDAVALSGSDWWVGYTCALRATGVAACWGWGGLGQLGNGSVQNSSVPVQVTGLNDLVSISASAAFACGVRSNGDLYCWGGLGSMSFGDLGEDSAVPVQRPTHAGAIAVAAGSTHVCTLLTGGRVSCWGSSEYGQLGSGFSPNSPTPVPVQPRPGQFENDATALGSATPPCLVREGGEVVCWGPNFFGQLGRGSTSFFEEPGLVPGIQDGVAVAGGGGHACALLGSGGVRCWGINSNGQLGNGSTQDSNSPVTVSGLGDAVAVRLGRTHTCAVRQTGNVACWGGSSFGALGNGSTQNVSTPSQVSGLGDAIAVDTSFDHTCAVRQTGQVLCWGRGTDGQLGNSGSSNSNTPVAVSGLSDAVAVATGLDHTCALRQNGQVACWGNNQRGALGNGTTVSSSTPVTVSGLSNVTSITAGGFQSTCVGRSNGQAACWGWNGLGQLGNGTFNNSSTPVTVLGLSDVVAVGGRCALGSSGEVSCWGQGSFGELGNGVAGLFRDPVAVAGFAGDPWRAWPYQVSVNGCPEPAAEDSASGSGTVTTDSEGDGATLADPIETTVTTPTSAAVEIKEGPAGTLSGFVVLGQQVDITTPASNIANPLELVFLIDGSLLPEGADEDDVQVFKNEALVEACVAAPFAIPDPCVLSRTIENGDVEITVLTSGASIWTFGVVVQSDLDGDGVLDGYDQCAYTPAAETVDANGCSIAQLCPCAGPGDSTEPWKNHGQYVSCVSQVATEFRQAGLIENETGSFVSNAARSQCGR